MSDKAIRRRLVFGFHAAVSILLFYLLLQLWGRPSQAAALFGLPPTLETLILVLAPLLVVIQFALSLMFFLIREAREQEQRKPKVFRVETVYTPTEAPVPTDYQIGDDGELVYRRDKNQ